MIDKLPTLTNLLKQLQQVPYLASKHFYRVANHFLEMSPERIEQFCSLLIAARKQLAKCATCWSWKETSAACIFCSDAKRNQRVVCVVETWYDLWALERAGGYQGVYHVLGGSICPLDGVGPEDLTIQHLIERVARGCDEIILALSQTPEGEATGAFIGRRLEQSATLDGITTSTKITCLARGIPVGSSLETLDRLTLHKALNERRPF